MAFAFVIDTMKKGKEEEYSHGGERAKSPRFLNTREFAVTQPVVSHKRYSRPSEDPEISVPLHGNMLPALPLKGQSPGVVRSISRSAVQHCPVTRKMFLLFVSSDKRMLQLKV